MQELILQLVDPDADSGFTVDLSRDFWAIISPAHNQPALGDLNDVLDSVRSNYEADGARFRKSFPLYSMRLRTEYGGTDRGLALFFRLRLPDSADWEEIRSSLGKSPIVQGVTKAGRTVPTSSDQGYVESRVEGGVEAHFAWDSGLPGSLGQQARVCLIDNGYQTNHPNLEDVVEYLPNTSASEESEHGTNCLGILVSQFTVDASPVKGIVSGLGRCFVSSLVYQSTSAAIYGAVDAVEINEALDPPFASRLLREGDVILIPQAIDFQKPVESEVDVLNAFRYATDEHNIIIVESAGGSAGGEDLDGIVGSLGSADESNAVIVGAGHSPAAGTDFLKRLGKSNFGDRVDCQAWGEDLRTTALFKSPNFELYTSPTTAFGGTSGAASIVAGVVALVQSVNRAAGEEPISPADMRKALRETGQAQPEDDLLSKGAIGSLPDIRELLRKFNLMPDCYLRDKIDDTGDLIPGPTTIGLESPDILTRSELVSGNLMSVFGGIIWDDEDLGEVLTRGKEGWVYLRLQNRGPHKDDPTIRLYWTKPGRESDPSQWHLIGEKSVQVAEKGSTLEKIVTEGFSWKPSKYVATPTLIAVVESTYYQTPGFADSKLTQDDLSFLLLHNKIAFRRVETKKDPIGCMFFWMAWVT